MLFFSSRKKFLIIPLVLILFFGLGAAAFAASSTYLAEATKYFSKQCKPKVKGEKAAICYLSERIIEQETATEGLGEKIDDMSENNFEQDKIIDVCFHVDTAALTVMKGGSCSPHVHWRIPVKCVEGKPCQPDNPDDPFYTTN